MKETASVHKYIQCKTNSSQLNMSMHGYMSNDRQAIQPFGEVGQVMCKQFCQV